MQPLNIQHGSIDGEHITRRDDVQMRASLWPTRADAEALGAMIEELAEIRRLYPRFLHASDERLSLFQRYFDDSSRAALAVSCRVGETFLAVDHRGAIKPCYTAWGGPTGRAAGQRAARCGTRSRTRGRAP